MGGRAVVMLLASASAVTDVAAQLLISGQTSSTSTMGNV
jgi:hypothetical protein